MRHLLVLGLAACWLAPAPAQAAAFCVQGPCPSGGTPQATLESALTAADATAERDRIEIGAGTLPTNATDQAGNDVDIVGAEQGTTVLQGTSSTVLYIDEPSSTLSDLTVRAAASDGANGVSALGGTLRRIRFEVAAGGSNSTAVTLNGDASFHDGTVAYPVESGFTGITPNPPAGQTVTIEDIAIQAGFGVNGSGDGTTNVRRVQVEATQGIRGGGTTLNVSSSLVRVSGAFSRAFMVASSFGGTSKVVNLRHVTAVGTSGTTGADTEGLHSSSDHAGYQSTINVEDSIVRGFDNDFYRKATMGTANLNASFVNRSTVLNQNSGSGSGFLTGAGMKDMDPGYVDPAAGNFRLAPGSPMIDAGSGTPLQPWVSPLDLDRAARIADGNEDGVARGDIGAYERQPFVPEAPPPPPEPSGGGGSPPPPEPSGGGGSVTALDRLAPAIVSFSLSRRRFRAGPEATPIFAWSAARRAPFGTRIRFSLSEAAAVSIAIERRRPGVRLRVRGRRRCVARTRANRRRGRRCILYRRAGTLRRTAPAGAGSVAFSGRIGRRALKPSTYRATITATDAAGNRSLPRRAAFRVVRR